MSSDPNQRHPNSTFQATYPYNQATVTRSGHELHFNDTPGNESIRLAHTTGTYIEIESSGRMVQTITEKLYSYIKSTSTQTIDSHYDLKIGGTSTLNIDQSSFEAVSQDKTTAVGGNLVDGVGGVRELHTESDKYESVNGDSVFGVKGSRHEAVEGDNVTSITGVKQDTLQSDWSVTSAASIEMNAEGKFRVKCDQFIVDAREITMTTVGGDVTITSGGKITINGAAEIEVNGDSTIRIAASGVTYINGSQVRLND
jgi:hypothetical protein